MDGTPRLRSAFPATPQTGRRSGQYGTPADSRRLSERIRDIPALQPTASSSNEPLIPEHIIDAPSQRLYAVTVWIALWSWKIYDYWNLQESEEQSLWLFMKWVLLDGIFSFGLPTFRIPWLEWSSTTMTLLFCAQALADGMLMFRIPIPIVAGFTAVGRSVWGAYEMAVNEHAVNPRTIEFNESLILGRQIIHILPEGSAILNPEKEAFCIDGTRSEARLPIMVNSTNPISIDLLRVDLETQANETVHISKSQIKTMHKEASRLLSYSDKPNEPKTLYYTVKKSGLYVLQKVVDESNLEVARKRLAHTVVVPCPKANIIPASSDRCRGELSNVELEVTGTPPLKVKYRKVVNQQAQEATFDSIQPEDFASPLTKIDKTALAVPNKVDTAWAGPQKVRVPLSESLGNAGRWIYSISEVTDGFGNQVAYSEQDHERQDRRSSTPHLHQVITVHERPAVNLQGCSPQHPMKVARGSHVNLPVQFGSTGRGAIADTAHHLEYLFSPQDDVSATGEHSSAPQHKSGTIKSTNDQLSIQEAGLYTVIGVSTDFCKGDVLEPASCILQNPPEPQLSISSEEIFDKCAGSPIGLRVDLNLLGTPPFDVLYRMHRRGDRHHTTERERVHSLRGQIELTPKQAGDYEYEFVEISDSVYHKRPAGGLKLHQSVKPAASASFVNAQARRTICIDDAASFEVALQGEGPFTVEYELVHNGKRKQHAIGDIHENRIAIQTDVLKDGGDYTLALVSVTDRLNCKEFLNDEAKISVRHQKPKVSFGQIEGARSVNTLEGKVVQLPLRLVGEAPWTVEYLDKHGRKETAHVQQANDRILVDERGSYQLLDVRDAVCPGQVDETAKTFEVDWIPRPELRVSKNDILREEGSIAYKADVCEGEEDAIDVLFKGAAPFQAQYTQHVKPASGAMAPKTKDLRAALNVVPLRLDTTQAGDYEYKFSKLEDANYDHNPKHFESIAVRQRVNAKPSVAFVNPGKTYSYCSVESDGEEVIPIALHGEPPFTVEVEIKHHGTARPETVKLTDIHDRKYNIRVPHSRLHLGKSAVSLRRVSDSRGCSRLLDSSTPRVNVAVYDAPTITPLENYDDFCVGDRINFALSGVAPFNVFYTFEGQNRKAVASGTTFRRLAEKPGTFVITGLQDSASQCLAAANLTKRIHGMPSVRVSHGRENYVDIHEGGEAEILFEFGGVPPFEFTYTRSANADKGARKKGAVLDMRQERSEEHSLRVRASEEGTYEVVSIRDRHCSYAKPGSHVDQKGAQKRLQY